MSAQKELVEGHVADMLAAAKEQNIPTDVLGRELLNRVIEIYRLTRSYDDIASELSFVAENLGPDTEFTFMRP